jgi:penicillin-binding protein 1C
MEKLTTQSVWVPSMEFQQWSKLPVSLPPLAPNCQSNATLTSGMQIESPQPNHRILLLDDGTKQSIPLTAIHNDPHVKLYWYVDNDFIGFSQGTQQLWWQPTAGTHTIAVEDGKGQNDQISVQVDHFSNVAKSK